MSKPHALFSLDSIELMQQILNDFLEAEYSLLAHIVRYAYQGNGLTSCNRFHSNPKTLSPIS